MAGLTAAQTLTRRGYRVQVVDKARRPGGRMASRRIAGQLFDTGAQFFTVRSPEFAATVAEWERAGLVEIWCRGFGESEDGHARYAAPGGLNSVAAHYAASLAIECETRLEKLSPLADTFDHVILTPPVPQALALLDEPVPELQSIAYDRCLALMVAGANRTLRPPGAWQKPDGEPISWIAEHALKPMRAASGSLTIHAGPKFSLEHWETPEEAVSTLLLDAAGITRHGEWFLHRWKFAKPSVLHPQRCHVHGKLIFAGDAFGEPRVEGAFLSGLAAAEWIATQGPAGPATVPENAIPRTA